MDGDSLISETTWYQAVHRCGDPVPVWFGRMWMLHVDALQELNAHLDEHTEGKR